MKQYNTHVGNASNNYTGKSSLTQKQFLNKECLIEHQRALHEGVKYFSGQCVQQLSWKASHAKHQRVVHKGLK